VKLTYRLVPHLVFVHENINEIYSGDIEIVRTSWMNKKSSPASLLGTLLGLDSVLSLHSPIGLCGGKGDLGLSPLGLPIQLAPM
jgi:hypothetical protein